MSKISLKFTHKDGKFCLCAHVKGTQVRHYKVVSVLEKSVQIDPCRRENVTPFGEIRLTLGDEIKMTPVGILRRGFFL